MKKAENLFYHGTYINLEGNFRATVENCRQILECTDILVKVKSDSFYVEIWGSELMVTAYEENRAEISGRITQVNLEPLRAEEKK